MNKRFLFGESPQLPLDGCDAESCHCRLAHYADRRHDTRRAETLEVGGQPWTGSDNKRRRLGRREADNLDLSVSGYFRCQSKQTGNGEDCEPATDGESEHS